MKLPYNLPKFFIGYCSILVILMLVFNYRGMTYFSLITGNQDQAQKSANHFHK